MAGTDELARLGLSESARLIRCGELSSADLAGALLARAERLQPVLNAYSALRPDEAIAQGRRADEAVARAADLSTLGPLHGVPVAVKDLYDVAGYVTCAGSPIPDLAADHDARVVERLRAAGAVILGKTLTHEWALGTTTINPHFGAARNPWDPTCHPGGSSGGNAAGLAAGLFAGAVGSDTGGSVRIPAAHCGVVGLKPTRGRVSLSGVVSLSWTLDHAGTMARTVADAALLLYVIEGYDPLDPVSRGAPAPGAAALAPQHLAWPGDPRDGGSTALGTHGARSAMLRGLRVGVPEEYFWDRASAATCSAVRRALDGLGALGGELVDLPDLGWSDAFRSSSTMLLADAAAAHRDHLRDCPEMLGPDVLERLRRGEATTGASYALARRDQALFRTAVAQAFQSVHCIAAPATPISARPIAETDNLDAARLLTSLTSPFNLAGVPAIAVPCGMDDAGLPIGLQIVAPWWCEARLVTVAAAYESATTWHRRHPALWDDAAG